MTGYGITIRMAMRIAELSRYVICSLLGLARPEPPFGTRVSVRRDGACAAPIWVICAPRFAIGAA